VSHTVCKKLVVDTTDPGIRFDGEGVSNHYHDFQESVRRHWHPDEAGQRRLSELVDQMKESGRGKDFDCIVGMSGGADSSYMLHRMVKDFGLRPLVFHVDAGWNSEVAVHNINVLVDGLGLDLFTEVIEWDEVKEFQLALFKSGLPNIDMPQDIAFIGVLFKYAARHGVKYILNGGNIATECVQYPLKYFYFADMVLMRDVLSRFSTRRLTTYPFTSAFYRKIYMPLVKGVRMVKPLNFMPYLKNQAMAELSAAYGWKPYKQKHFESRFTRFFEGWWLPERFGYDVRTVQFSSLILSGQMTREEALEELRLPAYDPEIASQDFAYIAAKLGIGENELESYRYAQQKYFWDYRNSYQAHRIGEEILKRVSNVRRGGAY
jgi:N-acetyl sugar amidotransferase